MFKALIIDDDKATVDVIRDTVDWASLGITSVSEAYDIQRAKEILEQGDMDIIISDIEMPRGTGLDLLEWLRERDKPGEFLLLTCHESFTYASQAIRGHAADYLLKPFDADVMEMALRKIVRNLVEQRRLLENDQWVRENRRRLRRSFWEMVLRGQYDDAAAMVRGDASGDLPPAGAKYYLVVTRLTNYESDRERFGPRLLRFALENIHSETLRGDPENDGVICTDYKHQIVVAVPCQAGSDRELEHRCRELMTALRSILSGEVTCCICGPVEVERMYDTLQEALDKIASNVAGYGGWFWVGDVQDAAAAGGEALDMAKLTGYLEQNRKRELLEYLKSRLTEAKASGNLTEPLLVAMREETMQAIHVDLARVGIPASRITQDKAILSLTSKSSQSALDLLRWATGAVNAEFQLKQALAGESDLRTQVDRYIDQHYAEDIGRDDIAEAFYLSPGYLGKIYKRSTGITINDRILEVRIAQAKRLLTSPHIPISDIAGEVGFGNQAYFSTIFKKATGLTPNEYRKNAWKEH